MTMPVSVTFRDIAVNDRLDALIRERAEALDGTFKGIHTCRILIEVPHRHHHTGNRYHVRIELAVPGDTIVVSHLPNLTAAVKANGAASKSAEIDADYRDAAIAVREAFDIARRRLQEFRSRQLDRT